MSGYAEGSQHARLSIDSSADLIYCYLNRVGQGHLGSSNVTFSPLKRASKRIRTKMCTFTAQGFGVGLLGGWWGVWVGWLVGGGGGGEGDMCIQIHAP